MLTQLNVFINYAIQYNYYKLNYYELSLCSVCIIILCIHYVQQQLLSYSNYVTTTCMTMRISLESCRCVSQSSCRPQHITFYTAHYITTDVLSHLLLVCAERLVG